MKSDQLLQLWAYNEWANRRILSAASGLPAGFWLQPAACSFGSLRGTLVHIYGAEIVWYARCKDGTSPTGLPHESQFQDLAVFSSAWVAQMALMRAYIAGISNFETPVAYCTTRNVPTVTPLWQILLHLLNHGTQFRSEAGMLLSAGGASPGDMDLIFYLRENPAE